MKLSVYEPNSHHLRDVLIFYYSMKKSAVETRRMLSNTYGENTISERMSGLLRFRNGDFHVEDWHNGGRVKVFKDAELEALLNEDLCQSQEELAPSLGVT